MLISCKVLMALVLKVTSLTGEPKPVDRLGEGGCDEKRGSGMLRIAVRVQEKGMAGCRESCSERSEKFGVEPGGIGEALAEERWKSLLTTHNQRLAKVKQNG
jgi:hypothetical protein